MSKVLRVASQVLAIAALIPGPQQPFVAAAATATGFAASLTAKKPSIPGTQTSFRADPNAPIGIVFGRTGVAGDLSYKKTHGEDNTQETHVTVLSGCGPCEELEDTLIDKVSTSFDGDKRAVGPLSGWVHQDHQLGLCPEPGVLDANVGPYPGWTTAHKLSGMMAVMNTFSFDAKGDGTFMQIPAMMWVGKFVKGYDPRLDDTYPGGAGACRAGDQTTWVWTQNPWIVAITYALGWRQGPNNIRVGGVGMPIQTIDLASYVEAANVADLNGWKIGGQVTTADDKWEVLKAIAQAGGGEPIRIGAVLSCFVNAPRLSLATITSEDIIGEVSAATTQTRRDRVNGIIPRYRSEDHYWEVVSAGVVRSTAFLAQDGRERTKEIEYRLVQSFAGETPDQAAQLAYYDMANAREAGPIGMPLKLHWLGYRAGDCLTISPDATHLGYIAGKQVVVLRRRINPQTKGIDLTLRTEDGTKHAVALSQVGVPAPVTDTLASSAIAVPLSSDWALSVSSSPVNMLIVEGEAVSSRVTSVEFEYRIAGTTAWTAAGSASGNGPVRKEISGIDPADGYEVAIRYVGITNFLQTERSGRLILGPTTAFAVGPQATDLTATGAIGSADLTWRNPTLAGWSWLQVWDGPTTNFADATAQPEQIVGGLGEVLSVNVGGLSAGDRTFWIVAYASDGTPYSPSTPDTVTVA